LKFAPQHQIEIAAVVKSREAVALLLILQRRGARFEFPISSQRKLFDLPERLQIAKNQQIARLIEDRVRGVGLQQFRIEQALDFRYLGDDFAHHLGHRRRVDAQPFDACSANAAKSVAAAGASNISTHSLPSATQHAAIPVGVEDPRSAVRDSTPPHDIAARAASNTPEAMRRARRDRFQGGSFRALETR
jgi:hypothetical protein